MFAFCCIELDCPLKYIFNFTFKKPTPPMNRKARKTIIANCQLKDMPNARPKQANANVSQKTPNLVPTICSMADASEERRILIAAELFSGRSK